MLWGELYECFIFSCKNVYLPKNFNTCSQLGDISHGGIDRRQAKASKYRFPCYTFKTFYDNTDTLTNHLENISHLKTNPTVGSCDDDQLAVQPLLAAVDPHRQLLPQPERENHNGGVEGGRGAEGEEGVQHPEGMGKPVASNSGWFEMLVWLVVLVATVANSGRLYSITSAFPLCRCGLCNSQQLGVGRICMTHLPLFCKIESWKKMNVRFQRLLRHLIKAMISHMFQSRTKVGAI